MKICIDPGHGGKDPGAVSEGVKEKNINLKIAKKLLGRLVQDGHIVQMTREDDSYVSLYQRANIANKFNADIFVSIHNNAADSSEAQGTETLFYPGSIEGEEIAGEVQTELTKLLQRKDRGIKDRADLVVLNSTTMPSILVECGFLTNLTERKLLQDNCFQDLAAIGIAEGIEMWENYIKEVKVEGVR